MTRLVNGFYHTGGKVAWDELLASNGKIDPSLIPDGGMERVELLYHHEQNIITLLGSSDALTFDQIAAMVEDTTKFVTMFGYDGEFLLPQYYDGGALTFTGLTVFEDYTASHRVIINIDNEIKSEVFDLARKSYVDAMIITTLNTAI